MPSTVKRFEEFSGGGQGIQLFGSRSSPGSNAVVGDVATSSSPLGSRHPNDWMYYLAWSIALVAFAVAWLIVRGRTGRAFRAVRDSETAAVSSGVSLARYKTLAFGVSAAYAGVAGGLFVIVSAFVNPDTVPRRALDLPARRNRHRRARRPVGPRLRRDLRRLHPALGAGAGPRLAPARSRSSRRRRSRAARRSSTGSS